jgi:hypothetical protein
MDLEMNTAPVGHGKADDFFDEQVGVYGRSPHPTIRQQYQSRGT